MEQDLQNRFALIQHQCPSLYNTICDTQVMEYIEHGEYGLAFELLTFKSFPLIEKLPPDVFTAIAAMIEAYDLREFSKNPAVNVRYDSFIRVAGAAGV